MTIVIKDFMVYLIRRILADHLGKQVTRKDLVVEIFGRTRGTGIKPALGPGWTLNEILRSLATQEMLDLSEEDGMLLITPSLAVEPKMRREFEEILARATRAAT